MTPPVTTVTTATDDADELAPSDYRDIYDELRSKCPLRQFADAIHSAVSFAWWSKYERGDAPLTRDRRNELRQAVGLAPLPPTVRDVLSAVPPAAAIHQIGVEPAARVVLVGSDAPDHLTIVLNGSVAVLDQPVDCAVTPVTALRTARKPTRSIRVSPDSFQRLQKLRAEAGMTWDEFAVWVVELCGV